MALKMTGVSKEELTSLAQEVQLQPHFTDETCYIASGPAHEMLAVLQSNGLFDVQLLEKAQAAQAVNETIRIFQQFATQNGSARTA